MRLIGTRNALDIRQRPSEMMGIDDEYIVFCFDEACAFIVSNLKNGKEVLKKEVIETKNYSRPSDLYKQFGE